jgi:hypothetical protein
MRKVAIEQRVWCPCPEYKGYQNLIDCKECEYHEEVRYHQNSDFVICSFVDDQSEEPK